MPSPFKTKLRSKSDPRAAIPSHILCGAPLPSSPPQLSARPALTAGGAVHYTLVQLKEDYRFAVAATWAIIVYVAGLLATKGAEWTEPIKIGAGRTVAAMKRLEVDGLVTAFLEGKKQK